MFVNKNREIREQNHKAYEPYEREFHESFFLRIPLDKEHLHNLACASHFHMKQMSSICREKWRSKKDEIWSGMWNRWVQDARARGEIRGGCGGMLHPQSKIERVLQGNRRFRRAQRRMLLQSSNRVTSAAVILSCLEICNQLSVLELLPTQIFPGKTYPYEGQKASLPYSVQSVSALTHSPCISCPPPFWKDDPRDSFKSMRK